MKLDIKKLLAAISDDEVRMRLAAWLESPVGLRALRDAARWRRCTEMAKNPTYLPM